MTRATLSPIVLLAALLSVSAVVYASTYRKSAEIQVATRAAPTSDGGANDPATTAKLKLEGITKIRPRVCTCTTSSCTAIATNQTLDGGYLDIWYMPDEGTVRDSAAGVAAFEKWIPNPDLTLPITQVTPANACRTFADIESPGGNQYGYAMGALRGVGVNAGDGGNYFRVVLEGVTQ